MTEDFLKRHIAAFIEHDSATVDWPRETQRNVAASLARFLWANYEQIERSEAEVAERRHQGRRVGRKWPGVF